MGFINEIKTHRYRTWKSICTSLLFTALGFHSAAFGPSLLDLAAQTHATIDQITHILPTKALGNAIGTTACGFLSSYFDYQLILSVSILIMSLSIIFVPLVTNLWSLYAIMMVNGLSAGFLVNAGNIFVIVAWGKENSPFVQLCHFFFGIGAFFAPFIVEPYLSSKEIVNTDLTYGVITTFSPLNLTANVTDLDVIKTPLTDSSQSELRKAYFIIGGFSLLFWAMFTITYFKKQDNKPHPTREPKEKKVNTNESVIKLEIVNSEDVDLNDNNIKIKDNCINAIKDDKNEKALNIEKELKPYHKVIIVILGALFIHLAYGLELSFGVMLPSYARLSKLQFDKSLASFVTSAYWGCFTFFRLCTLVLINFFSARTMLIFDLLLIMISNFILMPFATECAWALWVGSALMGIGVSSIYPTLWSYLEEILPVTSKMTSVICSCGCVGEFIVPVLIGAYIKDWPNIFLLIVFIYSLLACVIFGLLVFWEYIINKYKRS